MHLALCTLRFGSCADYGVADLVLLDANPLENIINTRRIGAVIWNGRVMDAEERRRGFEKAELAAK